MTKNKPEIYLLGEILLRLQIAKNQIWINQFQVFVGGAEFNVGIALSSLGYSCHALSVGPDNFLGHFLKRYLNFCGINNQGYKLLPEQDQGLYFVENGFNHTNSQITYQRKHSAFATNLGQIKDFEFGKKNDLLHVSGSSLLVSEHAYQEMLIITKKAKKRGLIISFDFNYRAKLANYQTAKIRFQEFLKLSDLVFGSPQDFEKILNYPHQKKEAEFLSEICKDYQLKLIAHTNRDQKNNLDYLSGNIYAEGSFYQSKNKSFKMLERIGGGDAFVAGIINGFLKNESWLSTLENAIDLAIYKQSVTPEDHLLITSDKLLNSNYELTKKIER